MSGATELPTKSETNLFLADVLGRHAVRKPDAIVGKVESVARSMHAGCLDDQNHSSTPAATDFERLGSVLGEVDMVTAHRFESVLADRFQE